VRAEHAEVGDLAAGLASVGLLASEGDFPFTDANGASRARSHAAALAIDGLVKVEARPADRHRVEVLAEGFFDDRQVPGMEQFPSATASQRDSRLLASASWSGPAAMGEGGTAGARLFVRRLGFAYGDSSPPMGPPISTSLVSWGFGAEGEVSGLVHPLVSVSAGASAGADFGTVRRSAGGAYDAHRSFVAAAVGVTVGRDAWPVWFAVRLRGEYDPEFADSDDWYRFRGFAPIPAAEVHAEATDWLRFSASASRAFRLPLFEELHFDAGYVKGNPDLLPEDAITWDAGFELGPRDDPWLQGTYFENRVFNAILFLPHSAWVTRAENSQDATMRGVEIQAGHRFEHVALAGSYTFLDSRGQGGLAMPQRPRHAASGEVVLELAPVRVIARARFQSSFFLDRFENREEEWRVMLDARAEYEPIPELRLALDFLNLLDKRDAVDALQQPIPGFAVYGSLKVSL
jgi:outer membrane receptor protein involved in Fe transport